MDCSGYQRDIHEQLKFLHGMDLGHAPSAGHLAILGHIQRGKSTRVQFRVNNAHAGRCNSIGNAPVTELRSDAVSVHCTHRADTAGSVECILLRRSEHVSVRDNV